MHAKCKQNVDEKKETQTNKRKIKQQKANADKQKETQTNKRKGKQQKANKHTTPKYHA